MAVIGDDLAVLVLAGPARSGSTSVSLALGLAAARTGRRVAVLTVDPSPSLAAAAGIVDSIEPAVSTLDAAAGELWVERLDLGATFECLVRAVADDEEKAQAILDNPLYGTLTASLPGGRDFMVLERMAQLRADDRFDLLVIDTPPARPAGEFVTAADRVKGFLGHPVYRALSVGQRAFGRIADAALSSFLGEVSKVAGNHVADDTTAFFRAFSDVEGGLRDRLDEVTAMLSSETSGFVVVTEPRPEAVDDGLVLLNRLREVGAIEAISVNRIPPLVAGSATSWAARESQRTETLVAPLAMAAADIELIGVPHLGCGPADATLIERISAHFADVAGEDGS